MTIKHKQFEAKHASIFQDESVVEAYQFRPNYPTETFNILMKLLEGLKKPWNVLDGGCGTGFVAREMVQHVDSVDAIDISENMIEKGRTLPKGDSAKLNWICSPIETAPLSPSYSLIVTAASLHWMDWDVVMPKFADVLDDQGHLAILEDVTLPAVWDSDTRSILGQYSMNKDYRPYDMTTIASELQQQGLFQETGMKETEPVEFNQSIEDWIESVHARNGFSRDRMDPADAAECDRKLTQVIVRHCPDRMMTMKMKGRVIWGKPLRLKR